MRYVRSTVTVCLRTNGIGDEHQTESELPAGPLSLDQSGACPDGHVVSGGAVTNTSDQDLTLTGYAICR